MTDFSALRNGLPNICGQEEAIREITSSTAPVYLPESRVDFGSIKSAWSIALHMQQPLIPAGGEQLETAEIISNLKHMLDNQGIGDNHNASVFHWCYKRVAEFVPQLLGDGKEPRVMLDYAGCLLYGLQQMGLHDVIDDLRRVTCDPQSRRCVEWLGCTWSHAVAPSTPVQDFRLHVVAWQHYFAGLFGAEALARVKGFSPAEMALPNHPEVAYEFVKTLKDCGYLWVLVQEHTVEDPSSGHSPAQPHLPHRLVARNSAGEEVSIIAIIKTQGSDTKLVAQMQPYYEAKSMGRQELGGKSIPPLVTQIGDGENGGVMMNEFPGMFKQAMGESSHTDTPPMNATEYLEHLFASGVSEADLPVVQPTRQKRLWDRYTPQAEGGREALDACIESIKQEDDQFNMEGGSWTSNISWEAGYENVLGPMNAVSAHFAEKVLGGEVPTSDPRYQNALFYLLMTQTSCYRYWGQGAWTDYAKELCRRARAIIENDF